MYLNVDMNLMFITLETHSQATRLTILLSLNPTKKKQSDENKHMLFWIWNSLQISHSITGVKPFQCGFHLIHQTSVVVVLVHEENSAAQRDISQTKQNFYTAEYKT